MNKVNPVRRVKVFGERNTGTRAVVRMLRAHSGVAPWFPNYTDEKLDRLERRIHEKLSGFALELFTDALDDIRRSHMGGHSAWKHAAPVVDESYAEGRASVLFLVRDPYSWIAALYRNPYHARAPLPETLAAFLEQPWLTMPRENVDPILMSPMALWNLKLKAYREFLRAAPVPSAVLQFEHFVLDPVKALSAPLEQFGISAKGLKKIKESTKKRGQSERARRKFYKTRAWEKEISREAAEMINSLVCWDIAECFGYTRRDPSEFGIAPG